MSIPSQTKRSPTLVKYSGSRTKVAQKENYGASHVNGVERNGLDMQFPGLQAKHPCGWSLAWLGFSESQKNFSDFIPLFLTFIHIQTLWEGYLLVTNIDPILVIYLHTMQSWQQLKGLYGDYFCLSPNWYGFPWKRDGFLRVHFNYPSQFRRWWVSPVWKSRNLKSLWLMEASLGNLP